MGVKNFIKKVGEKAGDKVATLSSLSPVQLEEVQAKREEYLLDMPKPDDELALEITEKMMAASSIEILNAYLPQIKELYLPIDMSAEYDRDFDVARNIRYINITKWVTDKNEKNLEKLVNVYAVLSNEDCNIALVFNRTREKTNVYLNKNNDDYIALSLLNKYASSNIINSTSINNNTFKNYYYERKRRLNSLKHLYHNNNGLGKVKF